MNKGRITPSQGIKVLQRSMRLIRPESELFLHIIGQAFVDLHSGHFVQDAINFLRGDELLWVCDKIDIEPYFVRQVCKHLNNGELL